MYRLSVIIKCAVFPLLEGRRMSRSASSMKDLVRQELSDYVDKKCEALPSLTTPPPLIRSLTKTVSNPNLQRYYRTKPVSSVTPSPPHMRLRIPDQQDRKMKIDVEQSDCLQSPNGTKQNDLPSPPPVPKPPAYDRVNAVRRHKYIIV